MWKRILVETAIVAVAAACLIGLTASIGVDRADRSVAAGREASATTPAIERSR